MLQTKISLTKRNVCNTPSSKSGEEKVHQMKEDKKNGKVDSLCLNIALSFY